MKTGELIETINSLNNAIFKFAKLIICAIIKNRLNDYLNFNQNKLDKIKSSKVIKNPNIMLEDYKNELKKQYQTSEEAKNAWDNVFVYQHFSMNRFSIDLKEFSTENKNLDLKTQLKTLGKKHKDEIF